MINLKGKILLFVIIGFLIFLSIFLLKVKNKMVDFGVNYKAAKRIQLGETLYRIEDGHYQFKYSPFSALLYLPLSFLPLSTAKAIWYFVILLSCSFILYFARILLHMKNKFIIYATLSLLILAKFFLRELQLGQINAFITVILLVMVWGLVSEGKFFILSKRSWAGLLWGLATALKPYALIFFPYFLIKKQWKPMFLGLGFLLLSLFIPSFFFGVNGNIKVLQEWKSSLSRSSPLLLDSQDNISILAFFVKWTGRQRFSLFCSIGVIIGIALFLFVLVRKGKRTAEASILDSSILFILIPLISPLGWDYTLLMSILGIMIILVHFFDYSKFWRIFLIINFFVISFSFYDLMGREFYAKFMSLSVITINFLIVLGYLSYLRLKRIC